MHQARRSVCLTDPVWAEPLAPSQAPREAYQHDGLAAYQHGQQGRRGVSVREASPVRVTLCRVRPLVRCGRYRCVDESVAYVERNGARGTAVGLDTAQTPRARVVVVAVCLPRQDCA